MTKIQKAKELIESNGKDHAIKYFQDKLDSVNEVYNPQIFSHVCELSALKTVIEFIKNYKKA